MVSSDCTTVVQVGPVHCRVPSKWGVLRWLSPSPGPHTSPRLAPGQAAVASRLAKLLRHVCEEAPAGSLLARDESADDGATRGTEAHVATRPRVLLCGPRGSGKRRILAQVRRAMCAACCFRLLLFFGAAVLSGITHALVWTWHTQVANDLGVHLVERNFHELRGVSAETTAQDVEHEIGACCAACYPCILVLRRAVAQVRARGCVDTGWCGGWRKGHSF